MSAYYNGSATFSVISLENVQLQSYFLHCLICFSVGSSLLMHATYKVINIWQHSQIHFNYVTFNPSRAHASSVILCSVHNVPLRGSTGALSVEFYNIG